MARWAVFPIPSLYSILIACQSDIRLTSLRIKSYITFYYLLFLNIQSIFSDVDFCPTSYRFLLLLFSFGREFRKIISKKEFDRVTEEKSGKTTGDYK